MSKTGINHIEPLRRLLEKPSESEIAMSGLARGLIVELLETGEIVVGLSSNSPKLIRCDCLESNMHPGVEMHIGDKVLVAIVGDSNSDGVILGRISRYRKQSKATPSKTQEHLTVESTESLSLTCGEASLQLRKDGKLMILGKEVLVRGKRVARIKGGTVGIN